MRKAEAQCKSNACSDSNSWIHMSRQLSMIKTASCHIGSCYRTCLYSQEIETSSLCPQLCRPQPLWRQYASLLSDPRQWILSIQILPEPGPYWWPNDRPRYLRSTDGIISEGLRQEIVVERGRGERRPPQSTILGKECINNFPNTLAKF